MQKSIVNDIAFDSANVVATCMQKSIVSVTCVHFVSTVCKINSTMVSTCIQKSIVNDTYVHFVSTVCKINSTVVSSCR